MPTTRKTKRRVSKKPKIIRTEPYQPVITREMQSAGGKAKAARLRDMRDQRSRRVQLRFAKLTGLTDLKYRPVLLDLARVSVLLYRCFQVLRDRENLLDDTGKLTGSVDTFRKLTETHLNLLKAVGLTPQSILSAGREDKEILAGFERIENMEDTLRENTNGNAKQNADA